MAGAGYKLFNTGDVLTAAQVNTYLMEQTVMVFADAAARTAALSGVVSEGMISYLKDTNAVEVYNGSAWVASDDPNAIQNTIVDAKGDLIAASAADTPARLAVGNNGETLLADSSTSTGLRWQADWNVGKNKFINGDFGIWQRGTSVNLTNNTEAYQADRWICYSTFSAGTSVYSRQTFTPGTAPVAGYEGKFFARLAAGTTSTYGYFRHKIEDVQTFAGQTVTISIWAKASGTSNLSATIYQNFGSGGSAAVLTSTSARSLSTSWTRYTWTVAIPSIAGKTVGTSSFLDLYFEWSGTLGSQTLDIWGAQIENGSVATAFTTATGTLAGELAACQRYYYRQSSSIAYTPFANGFNYNTTQTTWMLRMPVSMRSTPTLGFSAVATWKVSHTTNLTTPTSISGDRYQQDAVQFITVVASGLTAGQAAILNSETGQTAFIEVSAEL